MKLFASIAAACLVATGVAAVSQATLAKAEPLPGPIVCQGGPETNPGGYFVYASSGTWVCTKAQYIESLTGRCQAGWSACSRR